MVRVRWVTGKPSITLVSVTVLLFQWLAFISQTGTEQITIIELMLREWSLRHPMSDLHPALRGTNSSATKTAEAALLRYQSRAEGILVIEVIIIRMSCCAVLRQAGRFWQLGYRSHLVSCRKLMSVR
jgi:hypothetical protein